jgi:hypothetical protein
MTVSMSVWWHPARGFIEEADRLASMIWYRDLHKEASDMERGRGSRQSTFLTLVRGPGCGYLSAFLP